MNVDNFLTDFISTWEGGYSNDRVDAGNWYDPSRAVQVAGHGTLIGSNHGVTPAALKQFLGHVPSVDEMKALPLATAARIARKSYYDGPGFGLLPWNQVVASAVDFGWGAGPGHAVQLVQHMVGAQVDGRIGPGTVKAAIDWFGHHPLPEAAQAFAAARNRYYDDVIHRIPANIKYRNGWRNRSAYFLPGAVWWKRWGA